MEHRPQMRARLYSTFWYGKCVCVRTEQHLPIWQFNDFVLSWLTAPPALSEGPHHPRFGKISHMSRLFISPRSMQSNVANVKQFEKLSLQTLSAFAVDTV